MITKEEARNLVDAEILKDWRVENDVPIIIDEITIERDFGWVFFYDSRRYLETKEFGYMLVGNAPIIVNKFDATLHYTGTAYNIDYYIAEYERKMKAK